MKGSIYFPNSGTQEKQSLDQVLTQKPANALTTTTQQVARGWRFPSTRRYLWDATPAGSAFLVDLKNFMPSLEIQHSVYSSPDLIKAKSSTSNTPVNLHATYVWRDAKLVVLLQQENPIGRQGSRDTVHILCQVKGLTHTTSCPSAEAFQQQLCRKFCSGLDQRGPAQIDQMLPLLCCMNEEDGHALALTGHMLLPAAGLMMKPLYSKRLCDMPLTQSLMASMNTSGSNTALPMNGLLTMDQARSLLPLMADDPHAVSSPLVGIWVRDVSGADHPLVAAASLRYHLTMVFQDRVYQGGAFLVLLFCPGNTSPKSYECQLQSGNVLELVSYSFNMVKQLPLRPATATCIAVPAPVRNLPPAQVPLPAAGGCVEQSREGSPSRSSAANSPCKLTAPMPTGFSYRPGQPSESHLQSARSSTEFKFATSGAPRAAVGYTPKLPQARASSMAVAPAAGQPAVPGPGGEELPIPRSASVPMPHANSHVPASYTARAPPSVGGMDLHPIERQLYPDFEHEVQQESSHNLHDLRESTDGLGGDRSDSCRQSADAFIGISWRHGGEALLAGRTNESLDMAKHGDASNSSRIVAPDSTKETGTWQRMGTELLDRPPTADSGGGQHPARPGTSSRSNAAPALHQSESHWQWDVSDAKQNGSHRNTDTMASAVSFSLPSAQNWPHDRKVPTMTSAPDATFPGTHIRQATPDDADLPTPLNYYGPTPGPTRNQNESGAAPGISYHSSMLHQNSAARLEQHGLPGSCRSDAQPGQTDRWQQNHAAGFSNRGTSGQAGEQSSSCYSTTVHLGSQQHGYGTATVNMHGREHANTSSAATAGGSACSFPQPPQLQLHQGHQGSVSYNMGSGERGSNGSPMGGGAMQAQVNIAVSNDTLALQKEVLDLRRQVQEIQAQLSMLGLSKLVPALGVAASAAACMPYLPDPTHSQPVYQATVYTSSAKSLAHSKQQDDPYGSSETSCHSKASTCWNAGSTAQQTAHAGRHSATADPPMEAAVQQTAGNDRESRPCAPPLPAGDAGHAATARVQREDTSGTREPADAPFTQTADVPQEPLEHTARPALHTQLAEQARAQHSSTRAAPSYGAHLSPSYTATPSISKPDAGQTPKEGTPTPPAASGCQPTSSRERQTRHSEATSSALDSSSTLDSPHHSKHSTSAPSTTSPSAPSMQLPSRMGPMTSTSTPGALDAVLAGIPDSSSDDEDSPPSRGRLLSQHHAISYGLTGTSGRQASLQSSLPMSSIHRSDLVRTSYVPLSDSDSEDSDEDRRLAQKYGIRI